MSILRGRLTYRTGVPSSPKLGKHTPHMPPPLSTTTLAGRLLPGAVSAPHHTRAQDHSETSLCPAGEGTKVHGDPTARKEETPNLNPGLLAPKPGLCPEPQTILPPG